MLRALLKRTDGDLVAAASRWTRELPWAEWADESPRVRQALTEASQSESAVESDRFSPPPATASLDEMLEHPWRVNEFSRAHRHRFRSGLHDSPSQRSPKSETARFCRSSSAR